MKKKIILLSIIIFPSLIYFFFELTQANFKKMPYFGPKTVNEKGDTVYWSVKSNVFERCYKRILSPDSVNFYVEGGQNQLDVLSCIQESIDTSRFPVFGIIFLNNELRKEGYKLSGLIDYIRFKPKDLADVPLFFISSRATVSEIENKNMQGKYWLELNGEFDSIPVKLPNFIPLRLNTTNRDSFLKQTYFKQKPVYVFDYFMVLVDKKRHIRGYYDPSFNAEVKRMIDEYKHLKIRDEYAQTLKQNDIKQNEKK